MFGVQSSTKLSAFGQNEDRGVEICKRRIQDNGSESKNLSPFGLSHQNRRWPVQNNYQII